LRVCLIKLIEGRRLSRQAIRLLSSADGPEILPEDVVNLERICAFAALSNGIDRA